MSTRCVCTNFSFLFKVTADFWETWTNFEVQHGSEDTLKEMLRIKRSVQASYNTQVRSFVRISIEFLWHTLLMLKNQIFISL